MATTSRSGFAEQARPDLAVGGSQPPHCGQNHTHGRKHYFPLYYVRGR